MKAVIATLPVLLAMLSSGVLAEDFSFDASEYEKKTYEFNGYVEAKQQALRLQSPPSRSMGLPRSIP